MVLAWEWDMTEQRTLPVAEVRVTLLSLADGEAEVAIAIDPNGELKGAYGNEDERFQALQTLFEAVQRELADALDTLANGDESEDEPDVPPDGVVARPDA